jgi:hypothetical protein
VEGKKLDHRTDLYSLGVTYYQLLSGTLPFLGESPMEIAIKRTKEDPRPLENAFPGADARSCSIVMKLLRAEAGQRYQSATDLIRDLDAILTGPKPIPSKGPESTRKVDMVTVAKTKRRIQGLIHWDLITTAILLAFLSGGLASRGGAFIERWTAQDSDKALRVGLLVGALLAGAASFLVYRREISSIPRKLVIGLMLGLTLMLALQAGAWIDRNDGTGPLATVVNTLRGFFSQALDPMNRLAFGLAFLAVAAQVSFEREPGSGRVFLTRALMALGFVLFYAFGIGNLGVDQPIRQFMVMPELAIPLATATGLACFFGALLVTGYNFEARAKTFGVILTAAAAAGLFAFAVLIAQTGRSDSWTVLLREPFSDLGRSFRSSGALLAGVLLLANLERAVVFGGTRRQDRPIRKKI